MQPGEILIVECTDPLAAVDIPNLMNQPGDTIEVEIERFPGVLACAVVGVEDSVRGARPAAFVEAA